MAIGHKGNLIIVSLSGRKGHDLADDEFVEERLVRGTKMFAKKQATVKGLERISIILDFCAEAESAFKNAYEVHFRKKKPVYRIQLLIKLK